MGVQNQPSLGAKQWQAEIGYRWLHTDKFWIGDQRLDDKGPGGAPVLININSYNLNVAYAVSNRARLQLGLPFQSGSFKFVQGDQQRHTYDASGVGDITLSGEYWLSNPETASRVMASVGLGVKAPTGSDSARGTFYNPVTKNLQPGTIDSAAQTGDGGWGIILEAQGSGQVSGSLYAYASGFYQLSTKGVSDIPFGNNPCTATACPPSTVFRSVPDVYSARAGAGYLLPVLNGLFASLGGRIDGIPVRDLIGGGDMGFRRPGYVVYVDPGLTLTLGAHMLSFSVPFRVYQNRLPSLLERSTHVFGGADFADYLVVASYALRF